MEKSSFFNSVSHDRTYKAEDWAEYFASFIGNGVFPVPSTGLQVVANDGMKLNVKTGKAWINGYFYFNTGDLAVELDTADGQLNRIDRVVVRWDLTNRVMSVKVKSSSFSASPTAPALQRDADVYELALADIYVGAGVTAITQSKITDLKSSILVSDSPNSDGNYTVIYNSAPSAPPSITAPATCYSGQNIDISCAAATDPDGDALTYCFERSYNSGAWTQVQASASRTFTEAVMKAWNTLKYRVRAKDSYGNYSAYTTSGDIAVIHNQAPVISGSNADLGIKRADFTYQYSVTDPDGDTVNVVEKIDGKTIATKNAITLGATQTLSVSGNTFTALTNAKHTITITATDSAGNSAVRTLTFTKSIAGFVITLSTPLEANSQPTRANIKVTRDIPAGGTFKVEATNNPFDASPVWEDCTNAVVQGVAHVFTNKINTAAQYGMNIRVTVQRGDALTACWVSGIGGNFE